MDNKKDACPHCGSSRYIKHGKYNSVQRFLCHDCNRTFSHRTYTPWYYSKKSNNLWKEFWILQSQKVSLLKCAEKLKINIATAFSWRHKILNTLKHLINPSELCGSIYMTKKIIPENLKGNRVLSKRHTDRIWVILSADSSDNVFIQPLCTNRWNPHTFNNNIMTRISLDSMIFTSGDRYLNIATKTNNPVRDWCFMDEIKEYLNFNIHESIKPRTLVTNIISEFSHIKSRAFGVATKYLNQYFALAGALQNHQLYDFNSIISRWYSKKYYIKASDIPLLVALT